MVMWLSSAAIYAQSTDNAGHRFSRHMPGGFWTEAAIFMVVAILIVGAMIYWERNPRRQKQ